MVVEICTVGGYNEVGKNMTAVKYEDEVIILDMGLELQSYIEYTDEYEFPDLSAAQLTKIGAVPNLELIGDWKKKVKAIIPTHAHLDHLGAIPFLSNKFDAEILCTPFSKAVLEAILRDEKIKLKNKIRGLSTNSTYKISENIKIEFINMTHSTPQTVMVAIHTPEGTIVYGNDFKLDNYPTLGKKPNYKRLKEIGKKGTLCLILDSIYSKESKKTPSESVAKQMLMDVMLGTNPKGKAIIITTFSSHIARLKTIIEFGRKLNRKIIFLGRSLGKYVGAAEEIGLVKFSNKVKIVKFSSKVKKELRKLKDKKSKYLFVVTGHQAEPKAVLTKIINGDLPFKFDPGDYVIFSCGVIPTPINIANRETMESNLKKMGVRIFKDIHVSGHAAREDQRDLITLLKPKHIIPAHGDLSMATSMAELAEELGYKLNKDVHIMNNGARLALND